LQSQEPARGFPANFGPIRPIQARLAAVAFMVRIWHISARCRQVIAAISDAGVAQW
jgi:hypothetical protein